MSLVDRKHVSVVHAPTGGRVIPLGSGGSVVMKVEGSHSNGRLTVYEFTMPPRTAGPPTHIHDHWDEVFYVLSGDVTFFLDGEEYLVPTGGSIFVAGRVPHTFWNAGDRPATNLTMLTPSGLENYFDDVSAALTAGAPEAEVHALMAKHGIEVVDDGRPAYGSIDS
jgi:quercetin dioxygenase-like cupin family protein